MKKLAFVFSMLVAVLFISNLSIADTGAHQGGLSLTCDHCGCGADCDCGCAEGGECKCAQGGEGCKCAQGGEGCKCAQGGEGCKCAQGGEGCKCAQGGEGCKCADGGEGCKGCAHHKAKKAGCGCHKGESDVFNP